MIRDAEGLVSQKFGSTAGKNVVIAGFVFQILNSAIC